MVYIVLLIGKNRQITRRNQQISLQNDQISEQNQQLEAQNQQLIQQKREIQYSDSQILVDIAESAIATNDYATALAKSIAALPENETDDRPYYAKAEKTLIESLGIFNRDFGQRTYISNERLAYDTPISRFETDAKGETLFVLERYGNLSAVDLHSCEQRWSIGIQPRDINTSLTDPFVDMVICERNSSVIGIYDQSIVCVSMQDGTEIWRRRFNYSAEPLFSISSSEEFVAICAISTSGDISDKDYIQNIDLVVLRTNNGETYNRITIASNQGFAEFNQRRFRRATEFSQNGFFCREDTCFAGYYYELFDRVSYFVADLQTGVCQVIRSESCDFFYNPILHLEGSSSIDSMIIVKKGETDSIAASCECISLESGDLLWSMDTPEDENHFKAIDGYRINALSSDTSMLLSARDELYCIDLASGETIASVPLEAELTNMQWIYERKVFGFVLSNGYYALGWRTNDGFFDTRQIYDCYYYVQENSMACTSLGGFITPDIENNRVIGCNTAGRNGCIITIRDDSDQSLNIEKTLPSLQYDEDDVIGFPEDGFYTDVLSSGRTIDTVQFSGNHVLLTEWKKGKVTAEYKTAIMDRKTHEITNIPVRYSDPDLTGVYMFSDGSGILYINEYTGDLSKYIFSEKQETTLADQRQILLPASHNDAEHEISYIGYSTMAKAAYREYDGKLISVFCDGIQIRWWLDGEEQPPLILPDPISWQYNAPRRAYRFLAIGGNGVIVLSDFGENATNDHLRSYIGYDTINAKWLKAEDLSHESADRMVAIGTASPYLAVLDPDQYLRVYDMDQGNIISEVSIGKPSRYLHKIDFFCGDRNIIITTTDNRIAIYDVHTAKCLYEGALDSLGYTRAVGDSSGHRAFVYDAFTRSGIVFETEGWSEIARIDNVCGYDPQTDEIYFDHDRLGLVIRKVPLLKDLIDMGRTIID